MSWGRWDDHLGRVFVVLQGSCCQIISQISLCLVMWKGTAHLGCVLCWYHLWSVTESDRCFRLSLVALFRESALSVTNTRLTSLYSLLPETSVWLCNISLLLLPRPVSLSASVQAPQCSPVEFSNLRHLQCVNSMVSRPTALPCRPLVSCSCCWASSGGLLYSSLLLKEVDYLWFVSAWQHCSIWREQCLRESTWARSSRWLVSGQCLGWTDEDHELYVEILGLLQIYSLVKDFHTAFLVARQVGLHLVVFFFAGAHRLTSPMIRSDTYTLHITSA